jgi:hypothetical protein
VTASRDVSSHADTLGTATDDSRAVLASERVEAVHGAAAASSDGIAGDDGGTLRAVAAVCEDEVIFVVCEGVEVVYPDRERSWGDGATEEVVAAGLDDEADIVLAGCVLTVSFIS